MFKVALDTETHLIRPGMLFPKLVCVTFYDGVRKSIHLSAIGVTEVMRYLADPECILVGHNMAYDLGIIAAEAIAMGIAPDTILGLIFEAYQNNRIVDTLVRAMLIDIAEGKFQEIGGQRRDRNYGLDNLALKWLGLHLQKTDTWRLHYAYLTDKPIAEWPQDAIDYAIKDAVVTYDVDAKISQWAFDQGDPDSNIPNEFEQHRAAWVLHLIAGWGLRVDEQMIELVASNLQAQRTASYAVMDQYGIFKKDKLGGYKLTKKGARQKDLKRLRELIAEGYKAQGAEPPLTDGGKTGLKKEIKTDADSALNSGNPAAMEYAHGAGAEKLLNTYVPILRRGAAGIPITSSPNVLVASGRTSWTNPNLQNPPRANGVRECFVARPGTVFVGADLDTVELRALAQSCLELFGFSEMAAALQRGEDLHLSLAAEILGIDYAKAQALYAAGDPVVTEARQIAKIVNFGLPGGMGAKKFAISQIAAGQPLIKDPNAPLSAHIARAQELKETWFKRWPEMRKHLQNASQITNDETGSKRITQPWSGRIRGGLEYCSCANTYFQGRVADGTKLALWRIARACYVDKTSVLYGSRIVLFLHDEVILECPEAIIDACAKELVRLMCGAVQEVIPDVPISSTATANRRWFKGAKPFKINGILVPSKPQKDNNGKTMWIHDA